MVWKDLKIHTIEIIDHGIRTKLLTSKNNKQHFSKTRCCICQKKYGNDSCHYSREYRGVAHRKYSLQYQIPRGIVLIFHNGSTYD